MASNGAILAAPGAGGNAKRSQRIASKNSGESAEEEPTLLTGKMKEEMMLFVEKELLRRGAEALQARKREDEERKEGMAKMFDEGKREIENIRKEAKDEVEKQVRERMEQWKQEKEEEGKAAAERTLEKLENHEAALKEMRDLMQQREEASSESQTELGRVRMVAENTEALVHNLEGKFKEFEVKYTKDIEHVEGMRNYLEGAQQEFNDEVEREQEKRKKMRESYAEQVRRCAKETETTMRQHINTELSRLDECMSELKQMSMEKSQEFEVLKGTVQIEIGDARKALKALFTESAAAATEAARGRSEAAAEIINTATTAAIKGVETKAASEKENIEALAKRATAAATAAATEASGTAETVNSSVETLKAARKESEAVAVLCTSEAGKLSAAVSGAKEFAQSMTELTKENAKVIEAAGEKLKEQKAMMEERMKAVTSSSASLEQSKIEAEEGNRALHEAVLKSQSESKALQEKAQAIKKKVEESVKATTECEERMKVLHDKLEKDWTNMVKKVKEHTAEATSFFAEKKKALDQQMSETKAHGATLMKDLNTSTEKSLDELKRATKEAEAKLKAPAERSRDTLLRNGASVPGTTAQNNTHQHASATAAVDDVRQYERKGQMLLHNVPNVLLHHGMSVANANDSPLIASLLIAKLIQYGHEWKEKIKTSLEESWKKAQGQGPADKQHWQRNITLTSLGLARVTEFLRYKQDRNASGMFVEFPSYKIEETMYVKGWAKGDEIEEAKPMLKELFEVLTEIRAGAEKGKARASLSHSRRSQKQVSSSSSSPSSSSLSPPSAAASPSSSVMGTQTQAFDLAALISGNFLRTTLTRDLRAAWAASRKGDSGQPPQAPNVTRIMQKSDARQQENHRGAEEKKDAREEKRAEEVAPNNNNNKGTGYSTTHIGSSTNPGFNTFYTSTASYANKTSSNSSDSRSSSSSSSAGNANNTNTNNGDNGNNRSNTSSCSSSSSSSSSSTSSSSTSSSSSSRSNNSDKNSSSNSNSSYANSTANTATMANVTVQQFMEMQKSLAVAIVMEMRAAEGRQR